MSAATKFTVGEQVETPYGQGTVTYVTPLEKCVRNVIRADPATKTKTRVQEPTSQRYHVRLVTQEKYDFAEEQLLSLAAGTGTGN